jgi:HK97 gp10 family phage protein
MIKVTTKITGLDKLAAQLQGHLKRTLPIETRRQILLDEGAPVAARMTAMAPRGPHDPHAADFIRVTPVDGWQPDEARVAIGVVDAPGKQDRGFVLGFVEYGTRKRSARPFLRPTTDVEIPSMLSRVADRVAQELAK